MATVTRGIGVRAGASRTMPNVMFPSDLLAPGFRLQDEFRVGGPVRPRRARIDVRCSTRVTVAAAVAAHAGRPPRPAVVLSPEAPLPVLRLRHRATSTCAARALRGLDLCELCSTPPSPLRPCAPTCAASTLRLSTFAAPDFAASNSLRPRPSCGLDSWDLSLDSGRPRTRVGLGSLRPDLWRPRSCGPPASRGITPLQPRSCSLGRSPLSGCDAASILAACWAPSTARPLASGLQPRGLGPRRSPDGRRSLPRRLPLLRLPLPLCSSAESSLAGSAARSRASWSRAAYASIGKSDGIAISEVDALGAAAMTGRCGITGVWGTNPVGLVGPLDGDHGRARGSAGPPCPGPDRRAEGHCAGAAPVAASSSIGLWAPLSLRADGLCPRIGLPARSLLQSAVGSAHGTRMASAPAHWGPRLLDPCLLQRLRDLRDRRAPRAVTCAGTTTTRRSGASIRRSCQGEL